VRVEGRYLIYLARATGLVKWGEKGERIGEMGQTSSFGSGYSVFVSSAVEGDKRQEDEYTRPCLNRWYVRPFSSTLS